MADTADLLEQRIERIDAILAIQQLAARYALAVDTRDVDGWLALFVHDVDCGRRGKGREALRTFIDPALRTFYRSMHFIAGHVIDYAGGEHATGTVHCRAEHEVGDRWIVMAIIYSDTYARRDGEWYFVKRSEQSWYASDQLERPQDADFRGWAGLDQPMNLPGSFPAWASFWDRSDPAEIARLTKWPVAGDQAFRAGGAKEGA
jgi:SnoaL-like domain